MSTEIFPLCTKKFICIFLEFLVRLLPPGGSSTMPLPKKGNVWILAYVNVLSFASRLMMLEAAKARSGMHVSEARRKKQTSSHTFHDHVIAVSKTDVGIPLGHCSGQNSNVVFPIIWNCVSVFFVNGVQVCPFRFGWLLRWLSTFDLLLFCLHGVGTNNAVDLAVSPYHRLTCPVIQRFHDWTAGSGCALSRILERS